MKKNEKKNNNNKKKKKKLKINEINIEENIYSIF